VIWSLTLTPNSILENSVIDVHVWLVVELYVVLGHSDCNACLAGWATSLSAGETESSTEYSFFAVTIDLTDSGHGECSIVYIFPCLSFWKYWSIVWIWSSGGVKAYLNIICLYSPTFCVTDLLFTVLNSHILYSMWKNSCWVDH